MWPWPCPARDQDSVLGGHAPHGRPPDVIDGKNRDVDENIADVLSQSRIVDGNIADVLTKDRSVGEDYLPVTVCAPFSSGLLSSSHSQPVQMFLTNLNVHFTTFGILEMTPAST